MRPIEFCYGRRAYRRYVTEQVVNGVRRVRRMPRPTRRQAAMGAAIPHLAGDRVVTVRSSAPRCGRWTA